MHPRPKCKHCGKRIASDAPYVYFGVYGPFCNTSCREQYLALPKSKS